MVGSSLAFANLAHAQSAQDTALADALFEQGIAFESENKVAAACEKFEASRQLAPRPGTLYYLAACYEKLGRRASARAMFLDAADAAALAKDQEGAQKARQRADALLPVAKLRMTIKQPIDGLEIAMDGKSLGRSSWETELPVDAGKHTLRATAPGRVPWEKVIVVDDDNAHVEIEIGTLALEKPVVQKNAGLGVQRIAALAVGGVGVVGVGIGAVFGIKAITCKSNKLECSRNDFDTLTTGANAGFLLGGVGIAGAAVLWFTASANKAIPATGFQFIPVLAAGSAGGFVVGSF